MSDEKKMADDDILQAIGKLPKGTRETVAFDAIPHGRTRAEFRHIWLNDHLALPTLHDRKASVSADAAIQEADK